MSRGFTLVELLASLLIVSVTMLGVMTASVGAARTARLQQLGPNYSEAVGCAQQHLEQYRNSVAADDTTIASSATGQWQAGFPISGCTGIHKASIRYQTGSPPVTPTRMWCLRPEECDGAAGVDCYSMHVRVCWNGQACPTALSACS